jgi:putative transposase
MPDYRRNFVPGGTFFFTVTLRDRGADLLVARVENLREAVRRVRGRLPFRIDAWVVLPDHSNVQERTSASAVRHFDSRANPAETGE